MHTPPATKGGPGVVGVGDGDGDGDGAGDGGGAGGRAGDVMTASVIDTAMLPSKSDTSFIAQRVQDSAKHQVLKKQDPKPSNPYFSSRE